jgi:hypothetical protein
MTPELELLYAEQRALAKRVDELEAVRMNEVSEFKIGSMVEWGCDSSSRRGRVIAHTGLYLYGEPNLVVKFIKKDGTEGAVATISSWHKPRAAA